MKDTSTESSEVRQSPPDTKLVPVTEHGIADRIVGVVPLVVSRTCGAELNTVPFVSGYFTIAVRPLVDISGVSRMSGSGFCSTGNVPATSMGFWTGQRHVERGGSV